ncbi:MAG: hypothetical protein WCT54_05700 [Patescibacteria group bacterium]
MKTFIFTVLVSVLSGCYQNVRAGNASAVAGPGTSVSSVGCSVSAEQSWRGSYVRCECGGVPVQPKYDARSGTWICTPP